MRTRWPGILSILLPIGLLAAGDSVPRDLAFQERVAAQEAIERVYYSHQVGATKPFDEAIPRALLERKVRTYLKQSAALGEFWKTPVTGEMLRRELHRMAAGTRLPERLIELHDALGNDAFLIEECLARQILVNRLSRNFFAFDTRVHGESRREAEELRQQLADGRLDPSAEHPGRFLTRLSLRKPDVGPAKEEGSRPREAGEGIAPRELSPDELRKERSRWPGGVGEVSQLEEEREAFVIRIVLSDAAGEMRGAVYRVPKMTWDEWWWKVEDRLEEKSVRPVAREGERLPLPAIDASRATRTAIETRSPGDQGSAATPCGLADNSWNNGSLDDVPDGRVYHTAVWTGSLMLVWGGSDDSNGVSLGTGGRYDPATDTWSPITNRNAPLGRTDHTAVWTGSLMLVWGGWNGSYLNTGGRYDAVTDTWSPMSSANAPAPRYGHSAVWTGGVMAIWGGSDDIVRLNDGGRYDPAGDTWASVSTVNAPSARRGHTAVWTGSLMLVWGGYDGGYVNTGGRYDPVLDAWSSTSTSNAPSGRGDHAAVWTESLMVIWGGWDGGAVVNTGGRYDPEADGWTVTSTTDAPAGRYGPAAVWTGGLMLVWGGGDENHHLNTGGRYDPAADLWSPTSTMNAPSARFGNTAVWTGNLMVVWGGNDTGSEGVNTGARYHPATDTWTPTSNTTAPSARFGHTAIWTGNLMVVWGGSASYVGPSLNTGGRYDPATDSWTPTSITNAPAGRYSHTAIWTGGLMVVWGGALDAYPFYGDDGGRYDPISDTWAATSTINAPEARGSHTAIWTGSRMLVWGGKRLNYLDTGGRYDPAADNWTPTSITNAPSARWRHAAVWTGSLMLVWGGSAALTGGNPVFNTGGRYNPATDSWTPISTTNAPSARYGHKAVWTGSRMVIWGGAGNTGGRYDPSLDTWTPTSTTNAPGDCSSAVWTGKFMIVWGGYAANDRSYFNTGGRYDPAADTWTPTSTINAPSPRVGNTAVWTGSSMILWGGTTFISLSSGGRLEVSDFPDLDSDGHPGCADCDDADALVWHLPFEVTNLTLAGSGSTSLSWDNQGGLVGPGTTYDLVSGAIESGVVSFASGTCLQPDGSPSYSDTRTSPPSGTGYWYLARGKNSCGTGTYGTGQRDAAISSCP
jgi:N-acetylneuraminic acid mutarotase